MKKKISLLLLAALMCVMILPYMAFAYTGGLLDQKSMNLGSTISTQEGGTTSAATDDNTSTSVNITNNAGASNLYLWQDLGTATSIGSYQLKTGNSNTVAIRFYDANGTLLNTISNPVSDGTKTAITVINNVKKVALLSWNGGTTGNVVEFDIYDNTPVDTTPPANVTGLTAGSITATGATLSFTTPSDADFDHYNVYQGSTKVYTSSTNIAKSAAMTYNATGLSGSTSYSYKVTTVDTTGNESGGSVVTFTTLAPPDTTAPSVPTGLTANAGNTTAALSWTASTDNVGVDHYNIYQNGTKIGQATTTSYTATGLTNSQAYSFTVSAVDAVGNESAQSTSVSVTPLNTAAPNAPTGVTVTGGDTTATVSWTANTEPDVVTGGGYNLYQSTDGTTFTKVNANLITNTNFIVSALTNGTKYYFEVTAVNSSLIESAKSAAVNVTPVKAATVTDAPTNVTVKPNDAALTINWTAVTGAASYNVYVNGTKVNTSAITTTGYIATGLTDGTSYTIEVTAVNAVGESAKSTAVTGTPSSSALPVIDMGFNLSDVATGIGNWFGQIWLFLAFSVAIPLSFYIGRRVKDLFI